jgi:tetratricopeptide (TPR) repeat protein
MSMDANVLEWQAMLSKQTDLDILGLRPDSSQADARAAFVALARQFDPASSGAVDAETRGLMQAVFARISEAYRNVRPALALEPRRRAAEQNVEDGSARAALPLAAPEGDAEVRRRRVDDALQTAEEHVARRETEQAVTALHEVLTQADETRRRRIRLLLARAYAAEPRFRRYAVPLLRELIDERPGDAEALTALAALYQREGLLVRAEPLFSRALAADPSLTAARDGLRAVRAALGERRAPARPRTRAGKRSRRFWLLSAFSRS